MTAANARASATKPAGEISSARALGSIPASSSKGSGSVASVFRLCRSILRRWPNAASVTRSSARRSQASGAWRGARLTNDDVTLGEGTKALAATSKRMRASQRQPASTDKRP